MGQQTLGKVDQVKRVVAGVAAPDVLAIVTARAWMLVWGVWGEGQDLAALTRALKTRHAMLVP